MPMYKNVPGQKFPVYAYDSGADGPAVGDAANITASISKDGGASVATNDTNPTELDAIKNPGVYLFDASQAETNADMIVLSPSSGTAGIVFEPLIVFTTPVPNDISQAEAETAATDALTAYGSSTTGDLTAGLAALNDVSPAEVKAEADQALTDVGMTGAVTSRIDMNLSDIATSVWAAITATAGNFIADHVWRRSYAALRASLNGDAKTWRSPMGLLALFVNRKKVNEATNKLEVYEEDDATLFKALSLTGDPDADPTTEMVPD